MQLCATVPKEGLMRYDVRCAKPVQGRYVVVAYSDEKRRYLSFCEAMAYSSLGESLIIVQISLPMLKLYHLIPYSYYTHFIYHQTLIVCKRDYNLHRIGQKYKCSVQGIKHNDNFKPYL